MLAPFNALWADESGQDLVEYALLVALIAIVVIAALRIRPIRPARVDGSSNHLGSFRHLDPAVRSRQRAMWLVLLLVVIIAAFRFYAIWTMDDGPERPATDAKRSSSGFEAR